MKLLDSPYKPAFSACVTEPRLVEELRKRAAERKVTQKKCIEDILWEYFFHEPRPCNVKPSYMRKVCPHCGSEHILEPHNGFPLTCECISCKNTFDQPIWVMA